MSKVLKGRTYNQEYSTQQGSPSDLMEKSKAFQQSKVKRTQHHQTSFTTNAKGNSLGRKYKMFRAHTIQFSPFWDFFLMGVPFMLFAIFLLAAFNILSLSLIFFIYYHFKYSLRSFLSLFSFIVVTCAFVLRAKGACSRKIHLKELFF